MAEVVDRLDAQRGKMDRARLQTGKGAPGLTTRSKDATRGSWPYYWEQGRY